MFFHPIIYMAGIIPFARARLTRRETVDDVVQKVEKVTLRSSISPFRIYLACMQFFAS